LSGNTSPPLLLVEDDVNEVELMLEAFEASGITQPVRVLRDGEEAIAYLEGRGAYADRRAHPLPCLIFLDLKLPKKSGLEVVEWVKSQAGLKRIPVVIVSSSRAPDDVDRAYQAGANSYLGKPVIFKDFVEMIRASGKYWISYNLPIQETPRQA